MNRRLTLQVASEIKDIPLVNHAVRLLTGELVERAGIEVLPATQDADLTLLIAAEIGAEGYRIEKADHAVRITGNDPAGLFYGVGRFLHTGVRGDGGFALDSWQGTSVPACPMRGMYFAHNFHNWYRSAPLADLTRYVEDLALWGLNAIVFPCDTNPQCPPEEIEAIMLPKQLELIKAAKKVGIAAGMITVNTIQTKPDPRYAATPVPDTDPLRRGQVGHRVCPSHPEGLAALSARFARSLDAYKAVGLDFVVNFPYDEGGCGCEKCRPWGANGFVKACKELGRLARERFPGCRLIAGTWCFDVLEKSEGEYQGLDRAIRENPGWCDGIMCDSHYDYPSWPLEHGAPGGLPMINFAEISMWGRGPWGGYGANPLPRRIAANWRQSHHLLTGGLPYSEGRFEDLNKVMCLSLFWDKNADADAVVRQYLGYEFGDAAVEDMAQAIQLMEETYPPAQRTLEKAQKIYDLVEATARQLPARVRSAWRWRILHLRAIIDLEATAHPSQTGVVSDVQDEAFEELIRIYCAQNAEYAVHPPARSAADIRHG